MCWKRVGCKDEFFSSAFTIIIMSIGHSVISRERVVVAISSSCWFGGTRLS